MYNHSSIIVIFAFFFFRVKTIGFAFYSDVPLDSTQHRGVSNNQHGVLLRGGGMEIPRVYCFYQWVPKCGCCFVLCVVYSNINNAD